MIQNIPITAVKTGMRVFQVRGGSVSNEPVGWKMMTLDKSFSLHLTDEVSSAPRPGYARNDRGMIQVFAEV